MVTIPGGSHTQPSPENPWPLTCPCLWRRPLSINICHSFQSPRLFFFLDCSLPCLKTIVGHFFQCARVCTIYLSLHLPCGNSLFQYGYRNLNSFVCCEISSSCPLMPMNISPKVIVLSYVQILCLVAAVTRPRRLRKLLHCIIVMTPALVSAMLSILMRLPSSYQDINNLICQNVSCYSQGPPSSFPQIQIFL